MEEVSEQPKLMDCTKHTAKSGGSAVGLKLLGTWSSPYTLRVRLALKLKGLDFEYAEEDLFNKSPSLLLYNPIYKKVPVFLHDGRPLAESTIILQYIDDTWSNTHPILPKDPYERAIARFWCHFIDDKLGPSLGEVFRLEGEEQKAAVEEVHANLKLVEAELRDGHFKGRRFFGGDDIGLLDIVLGCGSYWLSVFEEVAAVKVVEPETFPFFSGWLHEFEELEEVKETVPPLERLMDYAKAMRQMLLSLAGSGRSHEATAVRDHGVSGANNTGELSSTAGDRMEHGGIASATAAAAAAAAAAADGN